MAGRTLILCIDRDDDIGYKAKVDSPCVGRDSCLAAATALGIADPEDSDTNAIFQTIKTYDDLLAKGEDVEIALLAGNHTNMLAGDRRIGEHLDKIVEEHAIEDCLLISDGAEDEYVLPIIQSRIKVASIVRVTIKQLPDMESKFYIVKKLLDDPKIAKGFLVPLGAILILFAVLAFIVPALNAILIVLGVIGIYIIFKGFGIADYFGIAYHSIIDSFKNGKFAGIAYICTLLLCAAGVLAGCMSMITLYPNSGYAGALYALLTFLLGAMVWFFAGGLVACAGKIADFMQNNRPALARIFVVPFFVAAAGLIAYGALFYYMAVSHLEPFSMSTTEGLIAFIIMALAGLVLAFVGIYFRPHFQRAVTKWLEKRRREEEEIAEYEKAGKTHYKRVKY
ncbi:MAG TPA: DUF373 family protein [Methanocorpusculum sp.]|nr:DUF373 family protein [Methanocorpusculum sp.]